MKERLKPLVRTVIARCVARLPWGVREAVLDACVARIGAAEVSAKLLRSLGVAEIGAWGELGLIRSAATDRVVLGFRASAGKAETGIVAAMQDFLAGGGTYLDIGANIGLTSIPIARNPKVRVVAFEPEPGNFRFLKLNVESNVPDSNVELHQVALFDRPGTLTLVLADDNLGDHRVTLNGVPGRRSIAVQAVPLDDFRDRISTPLAVKIDTQGAEPFVVAGGHGVLSAAGLLAMEFCPYLMRSLGGDPEIVIGFLSGFDRVALAEPSATEIPAFLPVAEAQAALRHKLRTARASDSDYLDIIARRGG